MILIPKLQKLRASEVSYLKRVTALYAYEVVVRLFPKELQGPCLQEVLALVKDRVPNIRIVALKVLLSVYGRVDEAQRVSIKSIAQGLTQDADQDVRTQAQTILAA
jgi:hypothetical protein